MANGTTISDLVGDGRGKWTVLTAVVLILASGVSWWITNEGRQEIAALRTWTEDRIARAIQAQDTLFEYRIKSLADGVARADREIDQAVIERNAQLSRVWEELSRRVVREAQLEREAERNRRLDVIERRQDRLEQRLFGRAVRPED